MQRTIGWFRNLKKWQKGGLIGCAVGVLFACSMMLSLTLELYLDSREAGDLGWWIIKLHGFLYFISEAIIPFRPFKWVIYGLAGIIVVVYGGYGAILGRFQQLASPRVRWLLTGLSVLFLLFIYWFNFQVAMWLEHA